MRDVLGLDLHLSMMDLGGLAETELFEALDLFGAAVLPAIRWPRGSIPGAVRQEPRPPWDSGISLPKICS